ncbi:MAG: glycosyltransferase family 88 protein [Alphaproteobacteria bacterium]|nr:hypothetical protein [Candidatus Jidaibacter sp.]
MNSRDLKGDYNKEYVHHIGKILHIWFNEYPDVFLNAENQFRTVKLREANPTLEINSLYDPELLSSKGMEDLLEFCAKLKITPVDINSLELTDGDKEVMAIAKLEIKFWKNGKCGNPAAASDIIRMMECVASKYCVYKDFDVEVKGIVGLNQTILGSSPICHPASNNDIISFGFNKDIKLSEEAKKIIKEYQKRVIYNYRNPSTLSLVIKSYNMFDQYIDAVVFLLNKEVKKYSIWQLRKVIKTLTVKELFEESIKRLAESHRVKMTEITDINDKTDDEILAGMLPTRIALLDKCNASYKSMIAFHATSYRCINGIEIRPNIELMSKKLDTRLARSQDIANLSTDNQLIYYKNELELFKHFASNLTISAVTGPMLVEKVAPTSNCAIEHHIEFKKHYSSLNSLEELASLRKNRNMVESVMCFTDEIGTYGDQSWTEIGAAKAKVRDNQILSSITTIQKYIRSATATLELEKISQSDRDIGNALH